MTFASILFERGHGEENRGAPECLGDLNLDQVIDAITAGKEEYELRPFFYTPLQTPGAIAYRHAVMRDLEDKALFEAIGRFAQAMRTRREYMALAERLGNRYQRERWFLEAVEIYCGAVAELDAALAGARPAGARADGTARVPAALRWVGSAAGAGGRNTGGEGGAGDGALLPGHQGEHDQGAPVRRGGRLQR